MVTWLYILPDWVGCSNLHQFGWFNLCLDQFSQGILNLVTKMHATHVGRGDKIYLYWYYPLPLPTLAVCIFVLKIITVALEDTRYMICNTLTTPSRPSTHALQVLATYMPQYHKTILPRVKMDIFVHTKIASPSEFQCDSNALIFSPIGHGLSELR